MKHAELLSVRDLHVQVGEKEILHGVNLSVGTDETHVLLGPNGTGKSTLGYAITGNPAYQVTRGSITFDGEDITSMPVNERAKKGVFLSFQNPLEVPGITLSAFIRSALEQVEATGYGIVMPSIEELSLEEPEIVRQGGRYGVRLEASAPSIHMMKTQIHTEITPIVGSEQQSEELLMYLLKEFEEDPAKIWESNIFGKSLHSLVNEGLHNKLYRMPEDAREKVRETIERIINDGCSGLLCIIL